MDDSASAPRCPDHGLPAHIFTSGKPGSAGRRFYKCPKPSGFQCKFFAWADELPSSQSSNQSSTPHSVRTGHGNPEPPSTPTPAPSMKRTFSALEEHGDSRVGTSPASLKRLRLIEGALCQSPAQEESSQPGPSTTSRRLKFKPSPQNFDAGITISASQDEEGTEGIVAPKTPTRSQNRLNLDSSALAPSPSLSGTHHRQQTGNRSVSTMDDETGSQGTLPDDNFRELTANSIADMLQQLSNIPDYVRKLENSEKKKNAAEKSRDAKESKIKYLEQEVERLKAREKELEAVIAAYEKL